MIVTVISLISIVVAAFVWRAIVKKLEEMVVLQEKIDTSLAEMEKINDDL